jgi:hypothetical protein
MNNYGDTPNTSKRRFRNHKEFIPYQRTKTYYDSMVQFHRLAREHYSSLNVLFYSQSGYYSPAMVPALDKNHRIAGLRAWDKKFGPILSGRIFKSGYGAGQPPAVFYLPFHLNWPAPFQEFPSDNYRNTVSAGIRAFDLHFRKKGWNKTRFHLMINHKQRRSIFPYNMDEPTRVRDYGMNRYYGQAVNAGKLRSSAIDFRLDIGHYECTHVMDKCDWLPGEIRCSHTNQMDGLADLYVVSFCHANPKSFERRKQRGDKIWLYMGASWVDRALTDMRRLLLSAYALGARGYCAWNCSGWDGLNPWKDPGARRGTNYLFYPGKEVGSSDPLPSLRLKMARRAVIDIEYLELLRKKKGLSQKAAAAKLRPVIRGFDPDSVSLMDEIELKERGQKTFKRAAWENFRLSLQKALV